MTTVTCPACGHTETGDSHHPHDAMTEHYRTHRRPLACGCQTGPNDQLWTCDNHTPAFLRERNTWRIANHQAGRWTHPAPQPSLFTR